MIDCNNFSQLLSDYLDGEISESRTRTINAHLAACPACKAKFDRARLIKKSMKRMQKITVSPTFEERLQQRIRQEIDNPQSAGFGPLPFKPTVVTLTTAAALTAMSLVVKDMYVEEEVTQQPVTPRLSTPPMPGGSQMQRTILQGSPGLSVGTVQDTTVMRFPYQSGEGLHGDVIRNLQGQSLNVKNVSERRDGHRK